MKGPEIKSGSSMFECVVDMLSGFRVDVGVDFCQDLGSLMSGPWQHSSTFRQPSCEGFICYLS